MATGLLSNPWLVESIKEFTYICCPECVYRTKEESTFQAHAIQNHPQSFVLFNKVEGTSNQQNAIEPAPGPCNVEIKEEPIAASEHEQAMSDFMDFIQEEAEVDHGAGAHASGEGEHNQADTGAVWRRENAKPSTGTSERP